MTETSTTLAKVEGLSVALARNNQYVEIVRGVSFEIARGATMSILGESGSGKSVSLRALMRLLPPSARLQGSISIDGVDVLALSPAKLRAVRGSLVSMIFQEPMTALDPVFTIGQQIAETILAHEDCSRDEASTRALRLLELVQVPSAKRRLAAYPHELSGGLRQRAMIALALSCNPKLLLADEPTTALDATVQIQVLQLLKELQREMGMAMIFVTHDMGVACEVSDTIAVMYAGQIIEHGTVAQVMATSRHPYTGGMLRSTVQPDTPRTALTPIPGSPPDLSRLPTGCAFNPRCNSVRSMCLDERPGLVDSEGRHLVRCHKVGAALRYESSRPLLV